MNFLEDKACVFLPNALGTYHGAWLPEALKGY